MTPFAMIEKPLDEWYAVRQGELMILREYVQCRWLTVKQVKKIKDRMAQINRALLLASGPTTVMANYHDNEPDIVTVGTFKTT